MKNVPGVEGSGLDFDQDLARWYRAGNRDIIGENEGLGWDSASDDIPRFLGGGDRACHVDG